MQSSPLRDQSYTFALHVIRYHQLLVKNREFILSKQLLKSGTSIGANIHEASYAQSPSDFCSKMSIALKEASETDFWLRLLIDSDLLKDHAIQLQQEVVPILRMLIASVKTVKGTE